jgi:hypothetical protein
VLLDPTAETHPAQRARVARLDDLAGRTLGLLDISKARGDLFLDRIEAGLTERGAKVLRFVKPTFTKPAPADLRAQIASECDAVIEALAD